MQGHFLHFATIAIALAANRHNVRRGSVQVLETPLAKNMAAIFSQVYEIAICISATSINSGVAAS